MDLWSWSWIEQGVAGEVSNEGGYGLYLESIKHGVSLGEKVSRNIGLRDRLLSFHSFFFHSVGEGSKRLTCALAMHLGIR